jgi:hypothetical protein
MAAKMKKMKRSVPRTSTVERRLYSRYDASSSISVSGLISLHATRPCQ